MDFNEILNEVIEEEKVEEQRRKEIIAKGCPCTNMDEREYIIENITKEEWEILEDNGIDWCPDDMFRMNQDAIIFGEDEYNKAMELLGRK